MNAVLKPDFSIDAFELGEIDPDAFDHQAHVYVAWLYLERFPLPVALGKFEAALRRLTVKLGIPGKDHMTITWFYLLLISERRADEPGADWYRFRRRNRDLIDDGGILERYYQRATLASDRARRHFVLPDRLAAR